MAIMISLPCMMPVTPVPPGPRPSLLPSLHGHAGVWQSGLLHREWGGGHWLLLHPPGGKAGHEREAMTERETG